MAAEDYFSSGFRHHQDSSDLRSRGRLDTAAYLAGYVIECSLKKLLEIHGPRRTSARPYGHDLKGMSSQALQLATLLSPAAARYRVDGIPSLAQAVASWTVDLRYRTTGDVTAEIADLLVSTASAVVKAVLVALVLDGVEVSVR